MGERRDGRPFLQDGPFSALGVGEFSGLIFQEWVVLLSRESGHTCIL
jgi:hypothetical protein